MTGKQAKSKTNAGRDRDDRTIEGGGGFRDTNYRGILIITITNLVFHEMTEFR